MNKCQLVGQLGRDPEVKQVGAKGTSLCKFSLATKQKEKDSTGNWVSKTSWHTCVAWGKDADFLGKYFYKGSWIGVVGRITYSEWQKDGVKQRSTEIVVESVEFVGPKDAGGGAKSDADSIPW